jgi:hypothetical protein
MSGGWLIPLNIHQSLALQSISSSSKQLRSISSSINSLATTLRSIEQSSIELAGTAGKILQLLGSEEHRSETIAAMRRLVVEHQRTCISASEEEDTLLALASCTVSERLLHQPWFDQNLFSHVSFDEMRVVAEIMENCEQLVEGVKSRATAEESMMIEVLIKSHQILEMIGSQIEEITRQTEFDGRSPTKKYRYGLFDQHEGYCIAGMYFSLNRNKGYYLDTSTYAAVREGGWKGPFKITVLKLNLTKRQLIEKGIETEFDSLPDDLAKREYLFRHLSFDKSCLKKLASHRRSLDPTWDRGEKVVKAFFSVARKRIRQAEADLQKWNNLIQELDDTRDETLDGLSKAFDGRMEISLLS